MKNDFTRSISFHYAAVVLVVVVVVVIVVVVVVVVVVRSPVAFVSRQTSLSCALHCRMPILDRIREFIEKDDFTRRLRVAAYAGREPKEFQRIPSVTRSVLHWGTQNSGPHPSRSPGILRNLHES